MENFSQLYRILNDATFVFENSAAPNELVLGLKQVFKNFFGTKDLNIFVYDEISKSLRNFVKPWENLPEEKFINGLISAMDTFSKNEIFNIKSDSKVFLPLFSLRKIQGIIEIGGEIDNPVFDSVCPLLSKQISLAVNNLKYLEGHKRNAKFYETIKNIIKITETQYDLSYILPIMGEMIDRFISEHLIYVFIKKKDFKLVWPNKCLIQNIKSYMEEAKGNSPVIKDGGKTCIFPLTEGKKITGAIVTHSPIGVLNENEIKYMEQLTLQASTTVHKAKEYMKVLENATLDALTGLNNRHIFYKRLGETVSNAKRQKTPLCCVMTDIDFFKSVNDTYGHAIGDLVLKTVAKTIKKELREYDIASRFGGEEFSVLLPNTPLNEAVKVAERLRKKIEKKKINIEDYKIEGVNEIAVTISVGVAAYSEEDMKDPALLYQKADKGLYIAKESGRNRVVSQ